MSLRRLWARVAAWFAGSPPPTDEHLRYQAWHSELMRDLERMRAAAAAPRVPQRESRWSAATARREIRDVGPTGEYRGPDLRSADPRDGDPWQLLGPVAQRRRLGVRIGAQERIAVVMARATLVQGAYLEAGDIAVLMPDVAARLVRVGAATLG